MRYKRRFLHNYLAERPKHFRAILITGPRRSGKSTLSRKLLEEWGGKEVVQFDTPSDQLRFASDPEGFLKALTTPVVLDEVQNVPEVFNYVKKFIDQNPHAACDYILTGSQQFQMMNKVSESLAGRVMIKELLPFCVAEAEESNYERIKSNFTALIELTTNFQESRAKLNKDTVISNIAAGGFPQALDNEAIRDEWFNSYLETYIQRDIRALSSIQNLAQFSRFLQLVAGRTGNLINYSQIGKDISVNYKTAQHYLSLLSASYLWTSIPPYFIAGSEKRITKSPKGIFLDSGLASYLTGLDKKGMEKNPIFGGLFESFVIAELVKLTAAFGKRVMFSHFRAGEQSEVDVVLEYKGNVIPIEIKASGTPDATWTKGIKVFKETLRLPAEHPAYVISLYPEPKALGNGVFNLPLHFLQ